MPRARRGNPEVAALIRHRLSTLIPTERQGEINEALGVGPNWIWSRLNDRAPFYADDIAEIARVLGIRLTDIYADTPAGQRELAERVEGIDREIVDALAGCTERQKRAVLDVLRGMRTFAAEEPTDGREA